MAPNVFERALEIIEEHGWYQGDWDMDRVLGITTGIGPHGELSLQEAWHAARAELDPYPRKPWWRRELPWALMGPYRARADHEIGVLRAAIEQVTVERLSGNEEQWNDERATLEQVRLALKVAARNLTEMAT